jgi:primosomal protein N' (replication factor Y)
LLQHINIALPVKINQEFTYSINFEDNASKLIGCRVLVKLAEKTLTGIIVNTNTENHSFEIKPILKLIDEKPILNINQIKLARWISDYYVSEFGIVLFSMLPSNFNNLSNLVINKQDLENLDSEIKLTPNNIKIVEFLKKHKNNLSFKFLKKNINISNLKQSLEQLENKGLIKLEDKFNISSFIYEDYIKFNYSIFDDNIENEFYYKELKIKSNIDKELIAYFRNSKSLFNTPISSESLKEIIKFNSVSQKRLKERGIIEVIKVKRDRSLPTYDDDNSQINELLLTPNPQQDDAIDKILDWIETDKKPILLNAVTGAGKTLVYMYLIREILDSGKSCLLMVPEIALTNNLFDRFEKAFPNQVHIYHSKMSPGSKMDLWYKLQNESGNFVIGTRSSIFLPFKDLNLVIIDEEHDNSYKQSDKNPRYNARDVAIFRSNLEKFNVLLASATPSLESYYNSKIDKYNSISITQRADNAKLPDIHVVDFLDAKIKSSVKLNFTKVLLDKLLKKIANEEQVILFLNRRGYSAFLMCRDCGDIKKCKNCDVALTYHKSKNLLHCHYCGYKRNVEKSCYECGSHKVSNMGIGTQRIEEDLISIFNELGIDREIRRLDTDTAKNEKQVNKIINDFQNNKFQILIGTQILSKGFNFKNLTLVGIINADLELYRSDFRANERTFQLLEQVSGRTGRTKQKPGEVVIQTYHPDNYSIKHVKNHDYNAFADEELEYRKSSEYPPFWRMNKIIFSGKDELTVSKTAKLIYDLIYVDSDIIKIYEPILPNISMMNNLYRQYIYIKIHKEKDKSGKIISKINKIIEDSAFKISKSVKIDFDVDTYSEI